MFKKKIFKKIIIAAIGLALAIALFFGGKYLYDLSRYEEIVKEIVIESPDLSSISDGTYEGSFDAIIVAADVSVTINDHKITNILINRHKNEKGSSAEVITEDVIVQQSLEVDAISGATNSSKVILKAIENALSSETN